MFDEFGDGRNTGSCPNEGYSGYSDDFNLSPRSSSLRCYRTRVINPRLRVARRCRQPQVAVPTFKSPAYRPKALDNHEPRADCVPWRPVFEQVLPCRSRWLVSPIDPLPAATRPCQPSEIRLILS